MAMRPDVASGLERIEHPLKRIGIVAMQNQNLPLSRIGIRFKALYADDLSIYGKYLPVPGDRRQFGQTFNRHLRGLVRYWRVILKSPLTLSWLQVPTIERLYSPRFSM